MVAVLKIGVIIAGIIVLIRLKVALSITLTASALLLGVLFRLSAGEILDGVLRAFLSVENLKLVIALELVLLFSAVLKENGAMNRAISALSSVMRDARFTVAIIPAVIGLLPVVGGAMLSAPLVAEASDELHLSPERRTFLNFWFRHVWEYCLPTFPAVFLTAGITGVPVPQLAAAGTFLTLAAVAAGVLFGFKGVQPPRPGGGPGSLLQAGKQVVQFVWNLLPFFLVVVLTVGLDVHLAYPLAVVTTGLILSTCRPPYTFLRLARQHLSTDLAFLIWGIMLFKEILAATGAMGHIAGEMSVMGIPPLALVILLPALIAFITGYTTAFVGLSFPVLAPFIEPGALSPYYVMLGLASGIGAHMLSPMHACLAMTLQYYEAGMGKTYRLLFMPTAVVFLAGVSIFAAANWLVHE
jgi:integral membrane protein (TIGR00529 family)